MLCITGGSGFLGSHLIEYFANMKSTHIKYLSRQKDNKFSNFTNVEHFEGDLLDPNALDGFCEDGAKLVHLAFIGNDYEKNLTSIRNLMSAANKKSISQLIHCSTAIVVGNSSDTIVSENSPVDPTNDYERTKLQVEKELLNGTERKYDLAILRPTGIFGEGGEGLNKLIQDILCSSRATNKIRRYLLGSRSMNLTPVSKVVKAIEFISLNQDKFNNEIVNVGDDENHINNYNFVSAIIENTIRGNAGALTKVAPHQLLSIALKMTKRTHTNPLRRYSSKKIIEMGFEEKTNLESEIKQYVSEYLND